MGDIADAMIDQMIDRLGEYPPKKRKGHQKGVGEGNWKDAAGIIIPMSSMSTEYIINCIKCCERSRFNGKLTELYTELQNRSEEQEYDANDSDLLEIIYGRTGDD